MPPEEVLERLQKSIADPGNSCHGMSLDGHAEIFVDDAERRFYSPWLSLTIEAGPTSDSGRAGTRLHGRFSPAPGVWTFYMFLHFFFGFLLFAGGMYGYSQWILGITPWFLLSVPIFGSLMLLVFLGSFIGRRLGRDQMEMLRDVVRRALD